MPLFKKPSFKASRKIPDRRIDAGATNTQLVDRQSLNPGIDFEQSPVEISLGGRMFVFQDGQWLCNGKDYLPISVTQKEPTYITLLVDISNKTKE